MCTYLEHGGFEGQAAERAVKQGLVELDDDLGYGGGHHDGLILTGLLLDLFSESEIGGQLQLRLLAAVLHLACRCKSAHDGGEEEEGAATAGY